MSDYPNPCEHCRFGKCVVSGCWEWELYYLHRQELINAWAKLHKMEPTPPLPPPPPPLQNPCDTCEIEDCHEVCKAREEHWDKAMERIRKQVGM